MLVLAGDWAAADYRVDLEIEFDSLMVNLEGPLITGNLPPPSIKAGPILYSSLAPKNPSKMMFALANNHSMDFGAQVLRNSVSELQRRGAVCAGFGENSKIARQTVFFEHDAQLWGWISACEPQFGISSPRSAGIASIGPWMISAIESAKKKADFVIVSIHGGNEDLPWVSPQTLEFYHELADAGASVVHGHHSHVPQGFERYGDTTIFYGLGNFAVNPRSWAQTPNALWSITARFNSESQNPWQVEPVVIKYKDFVDQKKIEIRYAQGDEFVKAMEYIEFVNEPLKDLELLSGLWQETAFYLFSIYGAYFMDWDPSLKNEIKRKLRWYARDYWINGEGSGLRTYGLTRQQALIRYHMISCDSHRNVLLTVLGVMGGEIEDLRDDRSKQLFHEYLVKFNIRN